MIRLPWPPSVNRAWRNVGNRTLLSREARSYRRQAVLELMAQNAPKLGGRRCKVEITLHAPDKRRMDIANREKQIGDALQCYGVFDDDSQIDDLRILRGSVNKTDPHVLIRVEAI
jgi:crossover junction endodeoxyribonuclease RusA